MSPQLCPKVSIVSTTHNQAGYARQAFDSFLDQQTDFPVEIIVADDASTDATPAIIREYAERYPHVFRPIFRTENLGLNGNLTGALSAARGEYVALCEADDYWIDPLKLSKQVAFLDRHPKTTVCFHPVRVIWEDGHAKDSKFPPVRVRGNLSLDALILMNFIQTNSAVYRRLERYDDIPADVMPLDWYLHVRHAVHGDIAMLPDTMAVYRRHAQGMWHNQVVDPPKFWLTQGPGHAATFDAMLDLFPGDPAREELIAVMADWILRQIANVPGPEGRAALQETIPGIDHPMVLTYAEAITGVRPVGRTVAVVGAGGIGFDVTELLVTDSSPTLNLKEWKAEWGVADPREARGALTTPLPAPPAREVYLLQRTKGPQGKRLGKTTGWVHRASLKAKGVHQLSGVNYEQINDDGLHISFGPKRRRPQLLAVDNVVVCAGQEPVRDLESELRRHGINPHIIGGAAVAAELDAKRAIKQGTELAARL